MKRASGSDKAVVCILCKRKFGSLEQLEKHEKLSELHKQNVAAQQAAEGHTTPRPNEEAAEEWVEHKTDDGKSFYYNKNTGQSLWEKPKNQGVVDEWSEHTADDGKTFYYNKNTGQSVWEKPASLETEPVTPAPQPEKEDTPSPQRSPSRPTGYHSPPPSATAYSRTGTGDSRGGTRGCRSPIERGCDKKSREEREEEEKEEARAGGGSGTYSPEGGKTAGSADEAVAEEVKPEDAMPVRPTGTVLWYNPRRRYGMIRTPSGEDLFLPGKQEAMLCCGETVSYSTLEMDGKLCAVDVKMEGNTQSKCILRAFETWDGHRSYNEDRHCFHEIKGLGFFCGLFDGHGGTYSAEYVSSKLHRHVEHFFNSRWTKRQGTITREEEVQMISTALTEGFKRTDEALLAHQRQNPSNEDGSTAVVCLIVQGLEPAADNGNDEYTGQTLFVANAGDCRCLLLRGKNSFRCSEDHKPDRKDEILRIKKAGGVVGKDSNGIARVGRKETIGGETKTYKYLSTSRGFGDSDLKAPLPLIISTPDIKVIDLDIRDWGILLACDGVWDVMTDQEVVDICVNNLNNPKGAATSVVRTSFAKGSVDNLSCSVLMLDWIAKNALDLPEKKVTVGGATMDDDMFAE